MNIEEQKLADMNPYDIDLDGDKAEDVVEEAPQETTETPVEETEQETPQDETPPEETQDEETPPVAEQETPVEDVTQEVAFVERPMPRLLEVVVPANADTEIASLEAEIKALDARLEEEDLSQVAYRQQTRDIQKRINDLEAQKKESATIAKINESKLQEHYAAVIADFRDVHPMYRNKTNFAALRGVLADVDEECRASGKYVTMGEVLTEAHKRIMDSIGPAETKKQPLKQVAKKVVPPSLHKVPQAAVATVNKADAPQQRVANAMRKGGGSLQREVDVKDIDAELKRLAGTYETGR